MWCTAQRALSEQGEQKWGPDQAPKQKVEVNEVAHIPTGIKMMRFVDTLGDYRGKKDFYPIVEQGDMLPVIAKQNFAFGNGSDTCEVTLVQSTVGCAPAALLRLLGRMLICSALLSRGGVAGTTESCHVSLAAVPSASTHVCICSTVCAAAACIGRGTIGQLPAC